MYYIVETKEQLDKLGTKERCFIDIISLSEEAHPSLTSPCIVYYNDFEKGYIFPINHSEGFSLGWDTIQTFIKEHSAIYCLDAKWHSYFIDQPKNLIDVYYTMLDCDNDIKDLDCYTAVHKDFYYQHRYLESVNTILPISKHYERCECMFESALPYIGKECSEEWYVRYTTAYKWVEQQGIKINEKVFDKHFEPTWKANSIKDGKIYTKYNLYNVTSRPSNAYNGINFLALPKDKSRAAFIPENDGFIEFDFDGYHLRLIANEIGYELPTDQSIHQYLGKQYFGKDEISPEEYQESKKITFRQLYNGIEDEYKHIEFFAKVAHFITLLVEDVEYDRVLELPNGRLLKAVGFTPQKLFNYYIQCLETNNNIGKLLQLKAFLEGKKSRVVLVVYDSILIDFSKADGRETLDGIRDILQENNYLVKMQSGKSYDFRQK